MTAYNASEAERLVSLCTRLVASGPKAAHVSASECHEIADGVHELFADRDRLAAALDELLAQTRVSSPVTGSSEVLADVMRRRYGREAEQWKANHDQRKEERDRLAAEVERVRKEKDGAYAERDRCVAGLAALAVRLGWSAWLGRHEPDPKWDQDWMTIVFINLPTGQVSWHIHDSEIAWFSFLPTVLERPWDGHTTPQKYERLDGITKLLAREGE